MNNLSDYSCGAINTFGAAWIPRDYSAGAGRCLACFHPTAIHKIE